LPCRVQPAPDARGLACRRPACQSHLVAFKPSPAMAIHVLDWTAGLPPNVGTARPHNDSVELTGRPTALPRPELRPGRPAAHFRRYADNRYADALQHHWCAGPPGILTLLFG